MVSLNAWGGTMFAALRAWLPSCEVDVVCLQEVTRISGLDGWTKFTDGERTLPQRANLFRDVADLLPTHTGSFLASDAGPVTDVDGRRWQQDFGIATFVHERLSVIDADSAFIHGSYTKHTDWGVDRPRVAYAVRLARPGGDQPYTVVNLHGLRDPAGKMDTAERLDQAERIADFVGAVKDDGDVVVVCGDFNILPSSRTFEILARVGLTDLVGDADTRTTRYGKPVRHANYMLVSEPERVRRFEIVSEPEVSDHRALLLEL